MRIPLLATVALAIALHVHAAPPPQTSTICIYGDMNRSIREMCSSGGVHEFTIYVFCRPNANGLLCATFAMKFPDNIIQGDVTVNPVVETLHGELENGVYACFDECQKRWVWTHAQTLFLTDSLPSEILILPPWWTDAPWFQNCTNDDDDVEKLYACSPFLLNPGEADRDPPAVSSVVDDGPLRVEVRFSECVSAVDAENEARYEVFELEAPENAVPVGSADLLIGGRSVRLHLGDTLELRKGYGVQMYGIRDLEGNAMPPTEEYFILTSAVSSGRVGLYLDEHRIGNCVDGTEPYTFDMWVLCRPGAEGQRCAEFSIDYPANVIPLDIIPNDDLVSVSMGDPVTGISLCYRHCAADWNCPFRQPVLVTGSSPTVIEIAPHPGTGESIFATCAPGHPTERIECISRILVNGSGHPLDLMGARAFGERTVIASFSKPLNDRTAEDVSRYDLFEGGRHGERIAIDESILMGDRVNVNLRIHDCLCEGCSYTLRIHGVEDRSGNAISAGSECTFTFGAGPSEITPRPSTLEQNYPNPFNPGTSIEFYLSSACRVRLDIFAVSGRRIATLIDKHLEGGDHIARWDGTDESGGDVRSGVYFCRLRAGVDIAVRKIVLLE